MNNLKIWNYNHHIVRFILKRAYCSYIEQTCYLWYILGKDKLGCCGSQSRLHPPWHSFSKELLE